MKKSRLVALSAAPLASVLLFAGCAGAGSGSMPSMEHGEGMPPSASSSLVEAEFNASDSMFAMMMIPHHQQAVEMSDMVLAKSGVDQRVRELAQQIKDAQAPDLLPTALDPEAIEHLGNLPGVRAAFPKLKLSFKCMGWIGAEILGRNVRFEVFADGVHPDSVDDGDYADFSSVGIEPSLVIIFISNCLRDLSPA